MNEKTMEKGWVEKNKEEDEHGINNNNDVNNDNGNNGNIDNKY